MLQRPPPLKCVEAVTVLVEVESGLIEVMRGLLEAVGVFVEAKRVSFGTLGLLERQKRVWRGLDGPW
jgi:hypothetical protein